MKTFADTVFAKVFVYQIFEMTKLQINSQVQALVCLPKDGGDIIRYSRIAQSVEFVSVRCILSKKYKG